MPIQSSIQQAHDELLLWCRSRDFAGSDPFDALNSRVLQRTPLRHSRTLRLVSTQLLKLSPLNLRPLALVPPQRNSKGIALFALASLARYRRTKTAEAAAETRELLDRLLRMQITGFHGPAWGYNFDWQSRHFFAPRDTPMIVPTAFAVRALLDAFKTFDDRKYLETARRSCEFILKDLRRTVDSNGEDGELCFSYSPLDETKVFNASLLAAETLAGVAELTGDTKFREVVNDLAVRAVRYVIHRQNKNGSWDYGAGPAQGWVDNFHTAYVLLSLSRILKFLPDDQPGLRQALERGYRFWRDSFFLAGGWPKYYHDSLYPADTHAAATAIVTLIELQELDREALPLAEAVAAWTISNLRDSRGFFYYQRRRFYTVRTPFMRWTEAWMLYALARLLDVQSAAT
ncbi:MAG TPA: prenyltransferase/squalene oxidase repeat-containing protein [Pyrinomonadaceae bacterium]|nr:prenyltransferase/squalene oxidase repeat-containing protein [Pyrinomonadaceae bacterium]